MSTMLPYSRCFNAGTPSTDPLPPDGPQSIDSRNFGIVWAPFNNSVGEMSSRASVFQELKDYNFRCLRVRYKWYYQETTSSTAAVADYDFHRIDDDFTDLIASNLASGKSMKLIIMLELNNIAEDQSEHGTIDHVVPAYMIGNATYDQGELEFSASHSPTAKFGYKAKLWNANVLIGHKRYVKALIDHIKATPAWYALFEGIGFTESSVQGLTADADKNAYFVALRSSLEYMREQCPTKMVFGSYNGPTNQLYTAINHLPTIQGCLWGPDVFPDQIGYWNTDARVPPVSQGCYVYMKNMTNITKYLDVQPQDYQWTASPTQQTTDPDVGHIPTIRDHYDFAIFMGLNYLAFTRNTAVWEGAGGGTNWSRVLTFMNTTGAWKTEIDGGLNSTAPATYL